MKAAGPVCKCLLPLLTVFILLAMAVRSKSSLQAYTNDRNDNPHKFHLVFTTNFLDHTMTYDPRAADEWLFYTGGAIRTNRP